MDRSAPAGMGAKVFVSFGESDEKYSAEIQNISSYSIKVWMKRRSDPGVRACIELAPGFQQTGTVLYCKREDIGCITVIDFDKDSRPLRSELRSTFTEPAKVSVMGFKKPRILEATTIDVSPSGISLKMDEELAVGALVKIELQDSVLFAEVRNCRALRFGRFRIGFSVEWKIMRAEGASATPQNGSWLGRSLGTTLFRARALFKKTR